MTGTKLTVIKYTVAVGRAGNYPALGAEAWRLFHGNSVGQPIATSHFIPEVKRLAAGPLSSYLKRIWFDTCMFPTDVIESLVAMVGTDRLMLGSHVPLDIGDNDPVGLVNRAQVVGLRSNEDYLRQCSRLFKISKVGGIAP